MFSLLIALKKIAEMAEKQLLYNIVQKFHSLSFPHAMSRGTCLRSVGGGGFHIFIFPLGKLLFLVVVLPLVVLPLFVLVEEGVEEDDEYDVLIRERKLKEQGSSSQ